jgi:hypothetical protein
MAIAGIPEIINDFNMYLSGNRLVGMTGEVTLPDMEAITETISGPGILGEYESGSPGRFGSMEQEVPFRLFSSDALKLIDPTNPVELTLRGSQQYTVQATGALDEQGMRVVFRGRCKKIVPGTVKQGGPMDSSITLELTYYMVEIDSKKVIELDKLNSVYIVNGVDLLAKIRRFC